MSIEGQTVIVVTISSVLPDKVTGFCVPGTRYQVSDLAHQYRCI